MQPGREPAGKAPSAALRKLASLYGIQTAYTDIFGRRQVASSHSLLEALRALGVPIHRADDVAGALRERRLAMWSSGLEPVAVAWDGKPGEIAIRLEASQARGRAHCWIELETGEGIWGVSQLEDIPTARSVRLEGKRFLSKRIPLPAKLPFGYHSFQVECAAGHFETLLISAPRRAYVGPERTWGVFLPLYSLHTRSSWGAGDFSDLGRLRAWISGLGGDVIATLPFLTAYLNKPFDPSPYMPASRLFWNEFYVDPRNAEEFRECPAAQRLGNSSQWQREIKALRGLPVVDYRRQMALKRPVLEEMARWLDRSKSQRHAAFRKYVGSHPRLKDYAAFRAVGERLQSPWTEWPERLRQGKLRPGGFDHTAELYHLYAQWLAEEQVQGLAAKGRSGGAGLYLDFPLGVHPHSYDVWREREVFAQDAAAGAPPDIFFTRGQNWGFPPLHPETIRLQGYAYWIACLQHQFLRASVVRIDHVMGLHRLFWIPKGLEATDGVYVRYHPEGLYAILCLESHRSKTMVVGENLGTVPVAVNRAMQRHGVQQMYVLQYEARASPSKPLRAAAANSAASLNTHDMPPFAAFVAGKDAEELRKRGLFDAAEAGRQLCLRRKVCHALEQFLSGKRRSKGAAPAAAKLARKCMEWLASGPARLLLVNLEDLWLETAPQNVPGTGPERANWRRKARYSLEEFTAQPQVVKTLRQIHLLRSRSTDRPRSADLD